MHITTIPPQGITPHPITDRLPAPDLKSPEFCALMASMAETGECPRPIALCNGQAVDNLDILAAAKRLGFGMVPVRQIEEHDAPLIAIADLVTRRHYTKAQIAFLAYPFLKPVFDALMARKIENLKKGQTGPKSTQVVDFPESALRALRGEKGLEGVAESLGISKRSLQQAAQIHRVLQSEPDSALRAQIEKSILTTADDGSSAGLGAILAGIAGRQATKGVTPIASEQLLLFTERVVDGAWNDRRFAGWDRATPEIRAKVADLFVKRMFESAPDEIVNAVLVAARSRRSA